MKGIRVEFDNIDENRKRIYEISKRAIDIIGAGSGLLLLSPVIAIVACAVKFTSKGPVFFSQKRVGKNGELFDMYKFRSMVVNAEELKEKLAHQNEMSGPMFKMKDDPRVTKVGKFLRKYRLDELPQIINILFGDLSFVGTRPEVPRYVNEYTDEMIATLLLPEGVTSEASIEFKDEEKILDNSNNIDNDYIYKVLPLKMEYNLHYIKLFTVLYDIKIVFRTVGAVLGLEENNSQQSDS